MPDHVHTLLSFPGEASMSRTIGDWKKYQSKQLGVLWQKNFFDHRLRNDEAWIEKAHYIRMNPVRAGLCVSPELWPWTIEPWRELSGGPGAPRTGEFSVATERDGHLLGRTGSSVEQKHGGTHEHKL